MYYCSDILRQVDGPCTGEDVRNSSCGVPSGTVRTTDFDFADDAVIFVETTIVFAGALDSLSEEAEPALEMILNWSRMKTKVIQRRHPLMR